MTPGVDSAFVCKWIKTNFFPRNDKLGHWLQEVTSHPIKQFSLMSSEEWKVN